MARYWGRRWVFHQGSQQTLLDTELGRGTGVDATAVGAGVQAGHIRGNELTLGHREGRRSPQEHLMVVEQGRGGGGELGEDLPEAGIVRQRRQKRHRLIRVC
jgi:hypothetical protein